MCTHLEMPRHKLENLLWSRSRHRPMSIESVLELYLVGSPSYSICLPYIPYVSTCRTCNNRNDT